MASLNIADSSYEITKKTIVINYTTDVILDNVQLSKDGIDFIDASSFSQVSALFDISSWENGTYNNCVLRATYENAKILIGVTEMVMKEEETKTLGVSLSKKILNDEVINIVNSDTSVATVDKTSLTFTPDNYDKIQKIEVVGVHNPDDVNKIANITLSNANMSSKNVSIYVNNIDIYRGEIVLSTTSVSVNENGTTTFTVKLDRKPTNNQIVYLSCENGNATLNKSSLTFTPSNYNVAQTVTVTGVYDNSINDKSCVIVLTSNEVETQLVNVTVKNIDHFGNIVLDKTSVSIDEGNTTTFTVKLDSEPSENQTVNISCNNSYATIDKASLTFTPSNYNTTQTVTISSIHNKSDYSDRTTIITLSSPNVENKTITIVINNIDVSPEVFGNIVTSTNTLSVNENNSVTFTVELDQAPTNNQTINLSVNNNNITLDKTSLTFTPSDYNAPQTVTVSGVRDTNSFDNKTSIITLSSNNVSNNTINVTIVNIDKDKIDTYPTSQGYVSAGTGKVIYNNYYTTTDYVDISCFRDIGVVIQLNTHVVNFTTYALYNENKNFIKGGLCSISSPETILMLLSEDLSEVSYIRISVESQYDDTTIDPSIYHVITFTQLS